MEFEIREATVAEYRGCEKWGPRDIGREVATGIVTVIEIEGIGGAAEIVIATDTEIATEMFEGTGIGIAAGAGNEDETVVVGAGKRRRRLMERN